MVNQENTEQEIQTVIVLSCPNCKEEFGYEGHYDEDQNESVTCQHCAWTASKWNFDYLEESQMENKCPMCGKFVPLDALTKFTPDNELTTEKTEWFCDTCWEEENDKK